MKKTITIILCAFALSLAYADAARAQQKKLEGTVTLSGAWAIYPTAVAWGEAFQKKHPGVKIDVSAGGAGKGVADALAGLVDIGMVSREPEQAEIDRGIVPFYILHDAVYPVVSDKNPFLRDLLKKGITKKNWEGMYITGAVAKWDDVIGRAVNKSVHVYTRSDSCGAAASWAKYFNKKQEDLKGIGIYGDPGVLDAAKKDPLGIAYSNFSYVFTREGTVLPGVHIVPVDVNENGIADAEEVFKDRDTAVKALDGGAYPVTRKNYLFFKGAPKGVARAFLAFALSDEGTEIVDAVGTSLPLPKQEREKLLRDLKQ